MLAINICNLGHIEHFSCFQERVDGRKQNVTSFKVNFIYNSKYNLNVSIISSQRKTKKIIENLIFLSKSTKQLEDITLSTESFVLLIKILSVLYF